MNFIEYRNVTKHFGSNCVLENVNIGIEKGQIVGFSGRNGSGKTVLFKLLAGLLRPTSGEILVNGKTLRSAFLADCGMMIETPGFIGHYSGYKNLAILNSVAKKRTDPSRIKALMSELSLDPDSKKHVSSYSLGQRQKLGIIQAVMNDPSILILDEPVNSLDDKSAESVLAFLGRLNADHNTTILIASHIKGDLDSICGRVLKVSDKNVSE
jgi:ABC-2 type transport system ATP-binding protein